MQYCFTRYIDIISNILISNIILGTECKNKNKQLIKKLLDNNILTQDGKDDDYNFGGYFSFQNNFLITYYIPSIHLNKPNQFLYT